MIILTHQQQIQYIKLDEVVPYINNPRNNEDAVEHVASSIKEFGFQNPIIVDKENVIIAGHTRYQAAKRLNIEEIPIIKASELTDAQIKAFRIADNKTAEYADWNNELLSVELEGLQELGYDLSLTGIEEWEIDNLLNPVSEDDLQDYFVEKDNKPKEPKTVKCPHCGEEFEQ